MKTRLLLAMGILVSTAACATDYPLTVTDMDGHTQTISKKMTG